MFNKGLATAYILAYGSLSVLSVIVTFGTGIGFWGVAGILGFGWLAWRELASLRMRKERLCLSGICRRLRRSCVR